MRPYEQPIFVSCAWGGKREEIVKQFDKALKGRNQITRDRRDLGYRGSIKEFLEHIGQGNCVILFVSDKYVHSPKCSWNWLKLPKTSNSMTASFLSY